MSEFKENDSHNPFAARNIDPTKTKRSNKGNVSDILDTEFADDFVEKIESLNTSPSSSEADINDDKQLPVIGKMEMKKQLRLVGGISIASLLTLIGGSFFYSISNDSLSNVVEKSNQFSVDVQRANVLFSESVLGKEKSFNDLRKNMSETKSSFNSLYKETNGLDMGLSSDIQKLESSFSILSNNFELLKENDQKVKDFNVEVVDMDSKIDKFISIYSRQALNQNELANVYALKISLQGINANYASILLADNVSEANVTMLNQYRDIFKDILITLKDGDRAKSISQINTRELIEAYNVIVKSWTELSKKVTFLTSSSKEMMQTKAIADESYKTVMSIVNKTKRLVENYKDTQNSKMLTAKILMVLSLIILILSLITIVYIYSYDSQNKENREKRKTIKTENYINEMTKDLLSIESGNLTKTLKLNDGITGYIADSINITIEALKTLVKKIIDTASILEEKTGEVNGIATNMLAITERQTKDIEETGESVIKISDAINKIAERTFSGSEEAKRSVEVSRSGEVQVGQSLEVMREIKINMEETVALMTKVSESSKQILNIVEILSEINQDTEILSMNVNVQSTRAGEAGKPFKIFADAIKKLAERAGNESRKGNSLLNAVMNDIKAVEVAIEKTRAEVQHGVVVTEKAYDSFQVMKKSTENLATTVEEISMEAKEYAQRAAKVQYEMREILMTTELNRKSTKQTAKAIEEIAYVAKDMAKSVNTFIID